MSAIGYYRYKTVVSGDAVISLYVDGVLTATKNIIALNECEGFIILKYLDTKGQYRFFSFNKYYRTFDNPDEIGSVNKFVVNLLTDKTNKQSVGYKNERKIELTAEADENQLLKLADIYTSLRVYYYIGTGTSDTDADWIEIKIQANENIIKRRKATSGRVDFTITLPERNTITML